MIKMLRALMEKWTNHNNSSISGKIKTLRMNEKKMEENSIVTEIKNTFDALVSRLGKWAWEYDSRKLPKLKFKKREKTPKDVTEYSRLMGKLSKK